jgi:VanZ family protein
MGVIAALGVVILLEVLQSVVPERDVTWLELVAKWLCALCGSVMMLIMSLVNGTRRR